MSGKECCTPTIHPEDTETGQVGGIYPEIDVAPPRSTQRILKRSSDLRPRWHPLSRYTPTIHPEDTETDGPPVRVLLTIELHPHDPPRGY